MAGFRFVERRTFKLEWVATCVNSTYQLDRLVHGARNFLLASTSHGDPLLGWTFPPARTELPERAFGVAHDDVPQSQGLLRVKVLGERDALVPHLRHLANRRRKKTAAAREKPGNETAKGPTNHIPLWCPLGNLQVHSLIPY